MNKTFKRIWNAVSTVLVAVIVLLAVLLVGTRVAGLKAYTVLSGSMATEMTGLGKCIFSRR